MSYIITGKYLRAAHTLAHFTPRYLNCPYPLNSDPLSLWDECQVWSHTAQITSWGALRVYCVRGNERAVWAFRWGGGGEGTFLSCKLNRDIGRWCTSATFPPFFSTDGSLEALVIAVAARYWYVFVKPFVFISKNDRPPLPSEGENDFSLISASDRVKVWFQNPESGWSFQIQSNLQATLMWLAVVWLHNTTEGGITCGRQTYEMNSICSAFVSSNKYLFYGTDS